MDDFERELKTGFLEEADQLLTDASSYLSVLASSPFNLDLIAKFYRVAHNLKGSGGAVGLLPLSDFAHKIESLLGKVKNKELPFDADVLALLTKCHESLCLMVKGLKENLDAVFDNQGLVQQIEELISGERSQVVQTLSDQIAALTTLHLPQTPQSPAEQEVEMDRELKLGFIEESAQLLTDIENYFLNLEAALGDPDQVVKIYRVAHNIKGSAGAVGFDQLSTFAFHVEALFSKLKNKELSIDSNLISLVLRSYERLWDMLNQLRVDFKTQFKNSVLIEELSQAVAPPIEPSASTLLPPPSLEPVATIEEEAPPKIEEEAVIKPRTKVRTQVRRKKAKAKVKTRAKGKASSVSLASSSLQDDWLSTSTQATNGLLGKIVEKLVAMKAVVIEQQNHLKSSTPYPSSSDAGPTLLLTRVVEEIQSISQSLGIVPIRELFDKIQTLAHDSSIRTQTDIDWIVSGGDTELDRLVLDHVIDSVPFLIQYVLDADAEVQVGSGITKTARTIRLSAYCRQSQIFVELQEGEGASSSDSAVLREARISEHKRRIQAVSHCVSEFQGEIKIETSGLEGLGFRVVLPLTWALTDGLVVRFGEEHFFVPLYAIHDGLNSSKSALLAGSSGDEIFSLRLSGLFNQKNIPENNARSIPLLIHGFDKKNFLVLVDDILGRQKVVIKKLSPEFQKREGTPQIGLKGSAILNDGREMLVLDLRILIANHLDSHDSLHSHRENVQAEAA